MTTEQRETLDAILRGSASPVGSDVNEQRRLLREAISAQPLPPDVTVSASTLGGVPTAEITVDGIDPRHVVLYFHGGVYVMSDAFLVADLASQVGRRTHAKVIRSSSRATTARSSQSCCAPTATTSCSPAAERSPAATVPGDERAVD